MAQRSRMESWEVCGGGGADVSPAARTLPFWDPRAYQCTSRGSTVGPKRGELTSARCGLGLVGLAFAFQTLSEASELGGGTLTPVDAESFDSLHETVPAPFRERFCQIRGTPEIRECPRDFAPGSF